MFHYRNLCSPKPSHPNFYEIGERAYLDTLVDVDCIDAGEKKANENADSQHWEILSLEQKEKVLHPSQYPEHKELVRLYHQAERLGIICIASTCEVGGDFE